MTEEEKKVVELTDDELEVEAGGAQYYTVKAGDTLIRIAERYGTTYKKLAACNGIKNPSLIRVGQRIRICY